MKKFAYRVVESTYDKVKVGEVLLYRQGRGKIHSEDICNTDGEHVGYFSLVKIGPCWVIDGKVQFEQPPAERGELTGRILAGENP